MKKDLIIYNFFELGLSVEKTTEIVNEQLSSNLTVASVQKVIDQNKKKFQK